MPTGKPKIPREEAVIPDGSDAEKDFIFYWTETRKKHADIAALLNEDHGLNVRPVQVRDYAKNRGLKRSAFSVHLQRQHESIIGQAERNDEWHRYAGYTATGERIARVFEDNPVALIKPHHPVPPGGYRLGMATQQGQRS